MLSIIPSSEYGLAICVRAGIVRVSVGLLGGYRTFFIIGRIGRSCLRLRGGLAFSFVGFALTAIGAFIFADTGVGYVFRHRFILYGIPVFLKFQPHERIFYNILAPGIIGEMGLHPTKLVQWRGQR